MTPKQKPVVRVAYDHSCFNQKYGGVSRYFVEVISRLTVNRVKPKLIVFFTNNVFLKKLNIDTRSLFSFNFRGRAMLERNIGDFILIFSLLRKQDFSVFHATHYISYPKLLLRKGKKMVVTIHDMNEWVVPEFYPRWSVRRFRQLLHMKVADNIIAVSDTTRKDICRFFPELSNKVTVISHGVTYLPDRIRPRNFLNEKPYILFVGARNKYKNFDKFLLAFALFRGAGFDFSLVICGPGLTQSEQSLIKKYKINLNEVFQVGASDAELSYFYSEASLFVFPSFYEGFGLPCLEAISKDTTIAISDIPVFREICQDVAFYFNPNDEADMCKVFVKAVSNKQEIKEKKNGYADILTRFAWEQSANLHADLYRKISNE